MIIKTHLAPPSPYGKGSIETFRAARRDLFEALCFQAAEIADREGSVTSDDLRFEGADIDRRILGAVFAKLVKEGVLEKVIYGKTKVGSSHRRPIARFVLVGERRAAE